MKRMGELPELVGSAVFLASDAARFIAPMLKARSSPASRSRRGESTKRIWRATTKSAARLPATWWADCSNAAWSVRTNRGRWYAPALTPDYIDELYELRWVLEPLALVKAAPRVSPQFIQRMRINLQDATENARRITGTTLDALEEEMHVVLLSHCGQRALMQAITLSQSLLIAHRFLYRWTPRLFDTEPFLPEHMEIVQCLEANEVDRASRALEQHLRVSRDRAVARVNAVVREFRPDELPYLTRLDLRRT